MYKLSLYKSGSKHISFKLEDPHFSSFSDLMKNGIKFGIAVFCGDQSCVYITFIHNYVCACVYTHVVIARVLDCDLK